MTILVQRPDTKEYLCDAGGWSHEALLALVFKTAAEAAEISRTLGRVNIIVKFNEERPPLILPAGKPSESAHRPNC